MSTSMSPSTRTAGAFTAGLLTGWLTAGPCLRRLRAQRDRARWRADHDPLTGLPHRTAARRHHQHHRAGVVLLLDLDRFKQVNDQHGHHAGDALLVEIATRLRAAAQTAGGLAARLAGDEFLLLLPAPISPPNALGQWLTVLDTLQAPVRLRLPGSEEPLVLQPLVSAGAAHTERLPWAEVLRRADAALYHAKTGRQRLVVHTPGMTHPAPDSGRSGARLRDQRRDHRPGRGQES